MKYLLLSYKTFCRYGLRLASMNFENEIVMIGGISQTTGEVFGRLKVKNLKFSNH